MSSWLNTDTLAAVAGISDRKARRALARAIEGSAWHGHALEVRTFHGRGGRSGLQYEVKVSSLPAHLQERLKTLQMTDEAVSRLRLGDDAARFERAWKFERIEAALKHPKGSAERKAEIDRLAGHELLDWTGNKRKLTKSTLYSWISLYETQGIHALAQLVRRDKGSKKVFISRAWMNTVPFSDEVKATIESDLKQYVRGLVKGGGQLKQTRILAGHKLKSITEAYGYRTNDPARGEAIFAIPQAFVQAEHHFKAVYRHKTDRKASEDNAPRIRRTTAALQPMEIVVMDVHHLNILVGRDDGTYSTPKLLAFHDLATGRVFCEIIQFDERGGVRNADIISAFVNMCQHPAFGVPQFLYADNGSEYGFADKLEDALKLGTKVIGFDGMQERNRVIRATPYNAAAKPVEGWFRQMNQQYFRHIQGWIDDDRMNPKSPMLGKLPEPYDEGFDAFCKAIFAYMNAYEHMAQKGQLKGKSPAATFGQHVKAGWKATLLDSEQLLTVFTEPETRVVKKHGIELRGQPWACDGLLEYFGRKVIVHVPKYHGFAELLITDEHGAEIGIAVADREFNVLDERGAKESARRKSVRNKALTEIDKSVPDIDVGAELVAFANSHEPVVPNEPDGMISVTRPGSQRRAISPLAVQQQSRQQQDEELRRQNAEASEIFSQMNFAGKDAS